MLKLLLVIAVAGCLNTSALDMEFILPDFPSASELNAAAELKQQLERCISSEFRIAGRKIRKIHVGNTPLVQRQKWHLENEEWRILATDDTLLLHGGGLRGPYYAVSIFLEKIGVYRWNQFEEYLPSSRKILDIPRIELSGRPCFRQRYIYADSMLPRDNGHFAAYNRLNVYGQHILSSIYGGSYSYGKPFMAHTFDHYIPARQYEKSHPEYFALVNGKRISGKKGQPCLSNPDVLEIIWEKLQEHILADEKYASKMKTEPPRLYDLSANDNNKICSCPQCRTVIAHEKADSGLLLTFLNKLALRLKHFRPNCYITTLAYWNMEKTPQYIKPEKNIIIRLCNTAQNYVTPISAEGSSIYREKIQKWSEITEHLMVWDYASNYYTAYHEHIQPIPNEFILQEQYKFYRKHKVYGVFMEHREPDRADMYSMKTWLEAKLFENPDADFNQLLNTFLKNYYGESASFIADYRRLLYKSAQRHNSQVFSYMIFPGVCTYLDLDTVMQSHRLLDMALKKVNHSPILAACRT